MIRFGDLIKRHGEMQAMNILEVLEELASTDASMKRILSKPEDRFVVVMDQLRKTEFAA